MSIKQDELVEDFTFKDLMKAYLDCRKRKRNTLSALQFEIQLEKNLLILYRELKNGTYKIGKSICFVVTSPKPREVWAANFRDRIVHHLIYNAIKDRFYKRFIKDSYSCIPNKGTLACAKQMLIYSRKASCNYSKKVYFLKADLSNFFVSINKDILFKLLCKYVKEQWIINLLKQVIYHDPKSCVYIKSGPKLMAKIPPYKSLWNSSDENGLPIGNLTSQFFSNVYLNELDQYVKNVLKCKFYCRYVDDLIILSYSPSNLSDIARKISAFVSEFLALRFNPKKFFINLIEKGIDFVGFFIKPHRLLLRRRTIRKIFCIVKHWLNLENRYNFEIVSAFLHSINSYLGMLINTIGYNLRREICLLFNSLIIFPNENFSKAVILY
ncbi:RNA-directed DNA polymerase [bacterium]|nr:RNA-directed DNA polymerase [bacterium]